MDKGDGVLSWRFWDMAQAMLFAILAAVTWGISPIFEKIGVVRTSPFLALFIQGLLVLFTMAMAGFQNGEYRGLERITFSTWVILAVAGLLSGLVAQFFYYKALQTGYVSQIIPLIGSLQLVISTFMSNLFLNEPIGYLKIIGIGFIIIGIYLVS
jgi:bacterial/archaeal transporter family protein